MILSRAKVPSGQNWWRSPSDESPPSSPIWRAIGRDSVITSPINGSTVATQTLTYDVMDRVLETETRGPPIPYTLTSV